MVSSSPSALALVDTKLVFLEAEVARVAPMSHDNADATARRMRLRTFYDGTRQEAHAKDLIDNQRSSLKPTHLETRLHM